RASRDIGKQRFSSLVEALDRSGRGLRAVVQLGTDLAPIHGHGHDPRIAHVLRRPRCAASCDAKSHDQRGKVADAQHHSPEKMIATRKIALSVSPSRPGLPRRNWRCECGRIAPTLTFFIIRSAHAQKTKTSLESCRCQ